MRRHPLFWATVLLIALVWIALSTGPYPLPSRDILALLAMRLTGGSTPTEASSVLFDIRLPRVLAAMLVGAALAGAGTVYQNLFRNPLVSPDILGVSSGAALGAVLAILLSLPLFAIQGFAFAGGLLSVALVYLIGQAVRGHDPILALVLTGVVVGSLLGAGIAMTKILADPYNQLPAITFWLMGSLAAIAPADLVTAAPLVLIGLVPVVLLRWRLNVLSLPDDEARALGVNVKTLRAVVIACATLMTAAAVAIAGVIGWIGLLVPHAARLVAGPEFARLLPLSLVMGAAFMLFVDTLSRSLGSTEIPPGVLASLAGAPLFLWLLMRTQGVAKP
jgi:iron complex transport system permease protein